MLSNHNKDLDTDRDQNLAIVRTLPKSTNGNFFNQVFDVFKREPSEALRYSWHSIKAIIQFAFKSPIQNSALLVKFAKIYRNVPGGVSILEMIKIVQSLHDTPPQGVFVEIGTWKGLSACCLSHISDAYGCPLLIVDTFEGLPESGGPYQVSQGKARGYIFEQGAYSGSHEVVMNNLNQFGIAGNIQAIPGDVSKLPPISLPAGQHIGFAFVDVDLPDSYAGAFAFMAPAIRHDTRIHLHEGLLDDVMLLCKDASYWASIGLCTPEVISFERTLEFRTLITELRFPELPDGT